MQSNVDRLYSPRRWWHSLGCQGAIDDVSSAVPWWARASRTAEQTANRLGMFNLIHTILLLCQYILLYDLFYFHFIKYQDVMNATICIWYFYDGLIICDRLCFMQPFTLSIDHPVSTAHFDLQSYFLSELRCLHHQWYFDGYMISLDLGFEYFKGSSKRSQSFESSLSELMLGCWCWFGFSAHARSITCNFNR